MDIETAAFIARLGIAVIIATLITFAHWLWTHPDEGDNDE